MTPESCPLCQGWVSLDADQFGERYLCWNCGWQQDLEADKPEHLAFLVQVATHNEEQKARNAHNAERFYAKHPRKKPGGEGYQKHGQHGGKRNAGWANFKLGSKDQGLEETSLSPTMEVN